MENFSTSESSLDAEVLGGFVCPPELAFEPRKPLTAGSATARCKEWSRPSRIDWNNAWSAGTGTRSSTRRRRPRATVDWAWKLPRLLWQRRLPEALPPCQNGIRLSYQFSRRGDGPLRGRSGFRRLEPRPTRRIRALAPDLGSGPDDLSCM